MSISNNLKIIRSQRGMTQGSLAEKAGIELTQVSRIERGASEPKLETIKKLAIALSCSTDELIMDDKPKTPEYIKKTVGRIDNLTPLNRYIVLSMINSFCNENNIPEPSLHEFSCEEEYDLMKMSAVKQALEDERRALEDLMEDISIESHELSQYLQ